MVYLQILWQNFNYAQIVASRNYYMPVIYSSVAKLSSKSNANEIPQIKFGSIFPDSNGTSQDIAYIVSFLYIIVFIHIFISLLFVCAWFQVHNITFSQPKNIFTLHFDFFCRKLNCTISNHSSKSLKSLKCCSVCFLFSANRAFLFILPTNQIAS